MKLDPLRKAALALLTAILLAGCASTPNADNSGENQAENAFNEPEVPKPVSGNSIGTCDADLSSNCAPLTVHTSGSSDFYLVLKSAFSEQKVATIYIAGGDTYDGGMPYGSYVLYYTAGSRWYGEEYFFGPRAPVSKADSDLEFQGTANGSSGVELTLYPVPGGNMGTSDASYSDLS